MNAAADRRSQETSQLLLIDPSDSKWNLFINNQRKATIFHHPAWLNLLAECYGFTPHVAVILDEAGDIRAGIPIMETRSWLTGDRWVSLPFSDYCNPLYQDEDAINKLTSRLVLFFQENAIKKLEIRWKLPDHPIVNQHSDFVLHTINLDPDPTRVSSRFKRTHLQNIHTAEERGVTVELGDQLEHMKAFYDLQLITRKRHGFPAQPWKYFKLLGKHIIDAGLGFILLAHKDREVIAGMVYLGWNRTLIAKYAASREDRFNLRPNNLLFWEGIRWGCLNGFIAFDMGRTEIENAGLRNFKSRWSAIEQPLYYSTMSEKTSPPSDGRLKRMTNLLIRNSPLWVCRLSGELLYRHMG